MKLLFANYAGTCPNCIELDDHYGDVIMGAIASQITSLMIVYSTVYSDADQRKHQSSASLAFVRGIHRGPVNSPHKWPVTRKMLPFDDVIMCLWTKTSPRSKATNGIIPPHPYACRYICQVQLISKAISKYTDSSCF